MPTEMLSEPKPAPPVPTETTPTPNGEVREWARKHVERVHKLERDVAIFLLGMVTLTGIWASSSGRGTAPSSG